MLFNPYKISARREFAGVYLFELAWVVQHSNHTSFHAHDRNLINLQVGADLQNVGSRIWCDAYVGAEINIFYRHQGIDVRVVAWQYLISCSKWC